MLFIFSIVVCAGSDVLDTIIYIFCVIARITLHRIKRKIKKKKTRNEQQKQAAVKIREHKT